MVGCVSTTVFAIEITDLSNGATVNESQLIVTGKVTGYTRGEAEYGYGSSMRLVSELLSMA